LQNGLVMLQNWSTLPNLGLNERNGSTAQSLSSMVKNP
jgi:hypothetical protein